MGAAFLSFVFIWFRFYSFGTNVTFQFLRVGSRKVVLSCAWWVSVMTWFSPSAFFWLPQNTLYLVSVGKNELISSSVNRFQLQSRLFSAVQPVISKVFKTLREQSNDVNFGLFVTFIYQNLGWFVIVSVTNWLLEQFIWFNSGSFDTSKEVNWLSSQFKRNNDDV